MFDFVNTPHTDNNLQDWNLVGWIPIFNPMKAHGEDLKLLADGNFDMIGGQFTFRDMRVFLDFTKFSGITLSVFKSKDFHHQTLQGCSPSGNYTQIGFSCQINKRLASAVEAYLNGTSKFVNIGDQQQRITNASNKIKNLDVVNHYT